VLSALVLTTVPSPVQAADFSACWVEQRYNEVLSRDQTVTRCRISGGEVIDYASDSDVPSVLHPNTGTDITGECWYYTSAVTQYLILAQYANGDADIGYDTDPANPGGIFAIGPTLPRCSTEPDPATDPFADVWRYVTQYIHAPPTPELSPHPGDGVTGMDTFVAVSIPGDHSAQISSGATTLDVYIEVSTVIVDWGDGTISTYPATETAMAGYPDGFARHVYESKHEDGLPIAVSYDWTARWRVAGGAWEPLDVPNTTTSIAYPIAEIVSVLSD
jgi:hypothetical protein